MASGVSSQTVDNPESPPSLFPAAEAASIAKSPASYLIKRDAILEPLAFPVESLARLERNDSCFLDPSKAIPIPCMVCDVSFGGEKAQEEILRHLLVEHKVVVHRVNDICCLKSYAEYWKSRFKEAPITEFAPVIRTNTRSDDPSEDYYLLSDALPEDRELRAQLQRKKLEAVLDVQQRERRDASFSRLCLFCSEIFSGNRAVLFQHMLEAHSFNVGQPDNLVFIDEFLDSLQQRLDNLQCLYCERTFRDRATLKEHMRKKQHKKINSRNTVYDKFYVINYLEVGKSWEDVQSEDDREIIGQEENDWNDWNEPLPPVFCLFCSHSGCGFSAAAQHMKAVHRFDFLSLCQQDKLDYYSQVKIVNYIRRQVYTMCCIHCLQRCQSREELLLHMGFKSHFLLPHDKSKWDQSQYLFPTYENDAFLYALDDHFSEEERTKEVAPTS